MDLFTPVVPDDQLHPNFKFLLVPGLAEPDKEVIARWADGFVDRDRKFVSEFQTTFNSSFWELYLFACLKELGWSCDFARERPDFVATTQNGHGVVAEAVIASNPLGYAPEHERDYSAKRLQKTDMEALLELATDRLGSAIWSKYVKYSQEYSKLQHVQGLPFVICVAPYEQPFFFWQSVQAIRRVLYGADELIYWDNPGTGERVIYGDSRYEWFIKDSGAKIPLAFFARPGMEGVSAVVFSCTATMSKVHALGNDAGVKRVFFGLRYNKHGAKAHQFSLEKPGYRESLLDGLAVFLNPFASNPIDPTWLSRPGIAIHGYDPESGQDWVDSQDGFLFARQCFTVLPSALSEQVKHRIPQTSGFKTRVLPEWAEGELQSVGGTVGLAEDNFMAHYRGWTVVVFRDVVDNDWGSNARPGIYHRLVKYIQANREDDKEMILCKEFVATKEDALAAVKEQIDKILGAGG